MGPLDLVRGHSGVPGFFKTLEHLGPRYLLLHKVNIRTPRYAAMPSYYKVPL